MVRRHGGLSRLPGHPQPVDRVVVVGWDCASPWLLMERWRRHLPHLDALASRGAWGRLRSCHPPITVPAWMVMASGQDAGEHGVYGFRSRVGPGYDDLELTTRRTFQGRPLWERLGAAGLRSLVVGVPGTWPPRPIEGKLVTGPLTPPDAPWSWPEGLGRRVASLAGGEYAFDIEDFRNLAPEALVAQATEMTRRRLEVILGLADDDDWNLLWSVEIGLDRLHHALWHHVDPAHRRFVPDSPLAEALLDYCRLLDEGLGRLVARFDDGDTAFVVVSDHGARPMDGGVRINGWLQREGLLVLREGVEGPTRFDPALVDWGRTRAWAMGGYCGRVFLNRVGREPQGVVGDGEVEGLLDHIGRGLEALEGPSWGRIEGTRVWRTSALYDEARGWPPELMVYFGGLGWRALDTLGAGDGLYDEANDTGPDAANHDWDGLIVAAGPGVEVGARIEGAALAEVASLVAGWLGVEEEVS